MRLAGVAELADAPDLGSGVNDVGVQVPSPAPPAVPAPNYRVSSLLFFVYHSMVRFCIAIRTRKTDKSKLVGFSTKCAFQRVKLAPQVKLSF